MYVTFLKLNMLLSFYTDFQVSSVMLAGSKVEEVVGMLIFLMLTTYIRDDLQMTAFEQIN